MNYGRMEVIIFVLSCGMILWWARRRDGSAIDDKVKTCNSLNK